MGFSTLEFHKNEIESLREKIDELEIALGILKKNKDVRQEVLEEKNQVLNAYRKTLSLLSKSYANQSHSDTV